MCYYFFTRNLDKINNAIGFFKTTNSHQYINTLITKMKNSFKINGGAIELTKNVIMTIVKHPIIAHFKLCFQMLISR